MFFWGMFFCWPFGPLVVWFPGPRAADQVFGLFIPDDRGGWGFAMETCVIWVGEVVYPDAPCMVSLPVFSHKFLVNVGKYSVVPGRAVGESFSAELICLICVCQFCDCTSVHQKDV